MGVGREDQLDDQLEPRELLPPLTAVDPNAAPQFASPDTIWYAQEKLTPDRRPPSSATGTLFSYDLNAKQVIELPPQLENLIELWRA